MSHDTERHASRRAADDVPALEVARAGTERLRVRGESVDVVGVQVEMEAARRRLHEPLHEEMRVASGRQQGGELAAVAAAW